MSLPFMIPHTLTHMRVAPGGVRRLFLVRDMSLRPVKISAGNPLRVGDVVQVQVSNQLVEPADRKRAEKGELVRGTALYKARVSALASKGQIVVTWENGGGRETVQVKKCKRFPRVGEGQTNPLQGFGGGGARALPAQQPPAEPGDEDDADLDLPLSSRSGVARREGRAAGGAADGLVGKNADAPAIGGGEDSDTGSVRAAGGAALPGAAARQTRSRRSWVRVRANVTQEASSGEEAEGEETGQDGEGARREETEQMVQNVVSAVVRRQSERLQMQDEGANPVFMEGGREKEREWLPANLLGPRQGNAGVGEGKCAGECAVTWEGIRSKFWDLDEILTVVHYNYYEPMDMNASMLMLAHTDVGPNNKRLRKILDCIQTAWKAQTGEGQGEREGGYVVLVNDVYERIVCASPGAPKEVWIRALSKLRKSRVVGPSNLASNFVLTNRDGIQLSLVDFEKLCRFVTEDTETDWDGLLLCERYLSPPLSARVLVVDPC